jgi:hypothetical protein
MPLVLGKAKKTSGVHSPLERIFLALYKKEKLPEPINNYLFFPGRKFSADFCWPDYDLIVEIDGGTNYMTCPSCFGKKCQVCRWTGQVIGRHLTSKGFQGDCEKLNSAASIGYIVLRFTRDDVTKRWLYCIGLIRQCLKNGGYKSDET